jgi:hypothetical protein
LLNGNTSILQDSLISINITNAGGVADSIHIPWIIESEGFLILINQFSDVLRIDEIAILTLLEGNLNGLACAIVGYFESLSLEDLHLFGN